MSGVPFGRKTIYESIGQTYDLHKGWIQDINIISNYTHLIYASRPLYTVQLQKIKQKCITN